MVRYVEFIPRVTGIIRSMLSFQRQFEPVEDDQETIRSLESALSSLPNPCPLQQYTRCLESLGLNAREVSALVNAAQKDSLGNMDPTTVVGQAWKIVKTVRLHQHMF